MTLEVFNAEIVVLAAGLSRRMGRENKLLMEFDGLPLVRRTVMQYRAVSDRVTVVLGHEASKVRAALSGMDVHCVVNPDYQSGRQSSAKFGLGRAVLDRDGLMIGLADQPMLTAADLSGLLRAFYASGAQNIAIPFFGEERGNPILFSAEIARRMRMDGSVPGCRKFIDANPHLIERIDVATNHFTADMDEPQDAATFGYLPTDGHHYRVGNHL